MVRGRVCKSTILCEDARPFFPPPFIPSAVCSSITSAFLPKPVTAGTGGLVPARVVCAHGRAGWRRRRARRVVILRADTHTDNLTPFFYEPIVKAKNGERGQGRQCFGKSRAGQDRAGADRDDRLSAAGRGRRARRSTRRWRTATGRRLSIFPRRRRSEEKPERDRKAPLDPNELEMIADLTEPGQEFVLCAGGQRRHRQRAFQELPQPGADAIHRGGAGGGGSLLPRTAEDRRRGAGRVSECGQVHAARAHLGGASEGGAVSVHDAHAAHRGRGVARVSARDRGRHPRADRRRARQRRARPRFPAAHRPVQAARLRPRYGRERRAASRSRICRSCARNSTSTTRSSASARGSSWRTRWICPRRRRS